MIYRAALKAMPAHPSCGGTIVAILLCAFFNFGSNLSAQELEPRAYAPAPIGLNFLVTAYSYSSGNVLLDPSLPVEDVTAHVSIMLLSYVRTLAVGGRQASVAISAPYAWGSIEGLLSGEFAQAKRSGLADTHLRFSVNLVGVPAMNLKEMSRLRSRTIVGLSLRSVVPTGQYSTEKLINLGSNRWAFKPEVGFSRIMGRWNLDLYTGVWMFTDNHEYLGASTREQAPIGTAQLHISYNLRTTLWAAFDATFFTGGRTTVDGIHKQDLLKNTRLGATLSVPIGRSQSMKFAFYTGAFTRAGADFSVFSVAYQYAWGGGL